MHCKVPDIGYRSATHAHHHLCRGWPHKQQLCCTKLVLCLHATTHTDHYSSWYHTPFQGPTPLPTASEAVTTCINLGSTCTTPAEPSAHHLCLHRSLVSVSLGTILAPASRPSHCNWSAATGTTCCSTGSLHHTSRNAWTQVLAGMLLQGHTKACTLLESKQHFECRPMQTPSTLCARHNAHVLHMCSWQITWSSLRLRM